MAHLLEISDQLHPLIHCQNRHPFSCHHDAPPQVLQWVPLEHVLVLVLSAHAVQLAALPAGRLGQAVQGRGADSGTIAACWLPPLLSLTVTRWNALNVLFLC